MNSLRALFDRLSGPLLFGAIVLAGVVPLNVCLLPLVPALDTLLVKVPAYGLIAGAAAWIVLRGKKSGRGG